MKYAQLIIKVEEGWKATPYHCSEGFATIGYGRKLSNTKHAPLPNITANKKEELLFVDQQVTSIVNRLKVMRTKAWNNCNEQQQSVLVSMAYQLGVDGLNKFNKMWSALESRNFGEASRQMLDSVWARQTPNRAKRHAEVMSTGSLTTYYLTKGALS